MEKAQQQSPPRMSVIDRIQPDDSNKGFLRALVAAIVFMLLSGIILVAGFIAWYYPQLLEGAKSKPITLTGKDFYIAIGKGDHQGDKLILKELDEAKSAVISSRKTRFNASRYPVVEYRITNRTPGAAVVLYWRTITHNHKTLFAKLHWNGDYLSAYNMSNEEEWKGPVTELGISVSGDLRNQPITIEQISFHPWTIQSLLLTVWTEWNAFEGWSQKSINVIRGMPKNALISPVVAAAAWCGLAIALYALWLLLYKTPKVRFELEVEAARQALSQTRHPGARAHGRAKVEQCRSNCRGRDPQTTKPEPPYSSTGGNPKPATNPFSITRQLWDFKAIVIMFMLAWLTLDGKWQLNLWRQLADTKYLFAGKTHHEQHLAAQDAQIYAYAKRLKEDVLPEEPVRLFILRNKFRDWTRLKLQYYLLPHNIYNFGAYPDAVMLKDGDFILAVHPIDKLSYSATDSMLHYRGWQRMAVELMDKTSLATLVKVRSSKIYLRNLSVHSRFTKNVLAGRVMHDAVLISGVPTYTGPDPGVPALSRDRNFSLRFQEWDYRDNSHSREQIPVLALEQGVHRMPDGAIWEVGSISIDHNSNRRRVSFESHFPAPPSLFLMPQNSSDETAISVRANKLGNAGFDLIVNTQESKRNRFKSATVGYLAIHAPSNQGVVSIEHKEIPYRLTQARISSKWEPVDGYELFLQEEQSLDRETRHEAEQVDVMLINNHVFAQVVSENETDTVSIRMRRHKNRP